MPFSVSGDVNSRFVHVNSEPDWLIGTSVKDILNTYISECALMVAFAVWSGPEREHVHNAIDMLKSSGVTLPLYLIAVDELRELDILLAEGGGTIPLALTTLENTTGKTALSITSVSRESPVWMTFQEGTFTVFHRGGVHGDMFKDVIRRQR